MNKQFYNFSWQAVGISSNPAIKRDPISLHMQNYLKWGSQHSEKHFVVVDDSLQAFNYEAFHGISPDYSMWLVREKGEQKLRDLSVIARAHHLTNVTFIPLREVHAKSERLNKELQELYAFEKGFYDQVQSILPARLIENLPLEKRALCAQYVLGELAMNLHMGGIRLSTPKETQKRVNELSSLLHRTHQLGVFPSFIYPPELGQEYVLGEHGRVEPYSGGYSDRRVLLTDSRRTLLEKSAVMNPKSRQRFSRWLMSTTGIGFHPIRKLYHKHIDPSRKALQRESMKIIGEHVLEFGAMAFALCFMTSLAICVKDTYSLSNGNMSSSWAEAVGRYR